MPTDQPSSAPAQDREAGGPAPDDRVTPARALRDDAADQEVGGGGLLGANADDPDAGAAMGDAGAATPNSPIDAGLPPGDEEGGGRLAEKEAQARTLGDGPSNG